MPNNVYGADFVVSRNPAYDTSTPMSGQITGVGVGTAVIGTTRALSNGVYIKALAANTGKVYVGNNGAGSVGTATGYELSAGDMILLQIDNLNQVYFDAATTDKVSWLGA